MQTFAPIASHRIKTQFLDSNRTFRGNSERSAIGFGAGSAAASPARQKRKAAVKWEGLIVDIVFESPAFFLERNIMNMMLRNE